MITGNEYTKDPLVSDIADIMNKAKITPYKVAYDVTVRTPNDTVKFPYLLLVEILANYNSNVASVINITANMAAGDFLNTIYKYKNELEVDLILVITPEVRYTYTYKALLVNDTREINDLVLKGQRAKGLNISTIFNVKLQAINSVAEVLRTVTMPECYKNSTVKSAISTSLSRAVNLFEFKGEKLQAKIVITEPVNTNRYDNIVIEDTINSLDIPSYIQNRLYGVYNGDLGTYVQDIITDEDGIIVTDDQRGDDIRDIKTKVETGIFVYPLYSTKETKRKVVIYEPRTKMYSAAKETYCIEGDTLKILALGEVGRTNIGHNSLTSLGGGIVATNMRDILDSTQSASGDKLVTNHDRVTTRSVLETTTPTNTVSKPHYAGSATNKYAIRSDITARTYNKVQLVWHYATSEFITPGMSVTYVSSVEDDKGDITVRKEYGTIQGVYYKYDGVTKILSAVLVLTVIDPDILKGE